MKFESVLDTKVDLNKVNIDVIKPWITHKLNDILGMEDDVVVEYVFTQLEEIKLDPKMMQINLTGFLNAKRSREFMAELWQLLVDAQMSPDGIPASLIEKKIQELKTTGEVKEKEQPFARAVETDWKHRYQSLTGGRYGSNQPSYSSQALDERSEEDRYRRDPDDDRDRYLERRVEREEKYFKGRKELLREVLHSKSPSSRRFSESSEKNRSRKRRGDSDDSEGESRGKKKHKHSRHHVDDSDNEKKSKKHKKEKKKKRTKDRE